MSPTASALGDQWYLGIGGGASLLQPNPIDRDIDVQEEQGQVGTFFLGRDFDSRSSGQFQLYSLGEAQFDSSNTDTATYYAGDASLLFRFFDSRDNARRGKVFGASLYGRFGLGFIERDSDLSLENNAQVYFGAGAGIETYLSDNLALRLESLYHDNDVGSATLSLVGRFGGRQITHPVAPPKTLFPQASTVQAQTQSKPPSELQPNAQLTNVPETALAASPNGLPDTVPNQFTPDTESSPQSDSESISRLPTAQLPEVYGAPPVPIILIAPSIPQLTDSEDQTPVDDTIPEVQIMTHAREVAASPETLPAPSQIVALTTAPTIALSSTTASASNNAPAALADSDNDGIFDNVDQCKKSAQGFPVDEGGCSVYNGTIKSIQFIANSAGLSSPTNPDLDNLARLIRQYPASRYEIAAHTDSSGTDSERSDITRSRLGTIVRYLLKQGLSKSQLADQLQLRSFGGQRPNYTNSSVQGREKNNRIEVFEFIGP